MLFIRCFGSVGILHPSAREGHVGIQPGYSDPLARPLFHWMRQRTFSVSVKADGILAASLETWNPLATCARLGFCCLPAVVAAALWRMTVVEMGSGQIGALVCSATASHCGWHSSFPGRSTWKQETGWKPYRPRRRKASDRFRLHGNNCCALERDAYTTLVFPLL